MSSTRVSAKISSRLTGGADILLVVGSKKIGMSKIVNAARHLKLPVEKLLGDWIVCIPGFTLDKYRELQRSHLSIFAQNCFGGFISHTLGLPFRSPFVNMFLLAKEYLSFLREPRARLENDLIFKKKILNDIKGFYYPVFTLGDVDLYMNHYRDFDEAVAKWNERKQKINWDNLFVMAYTEDENVLREFDTLPYDKKACFVPFKSDLNSAWYINTKPTKKLPWWKIINNFAEGKIFYYDVFDMLLHGKKTPLIEM